ncbi:aspartate 1-decarboxylase [Alicyclobacillus hesperidum URH17-3-68]|uniref:Aspartate 1-decarboxylase n=1 Tax=Alicyclobacillus hesperidum TaxID=89784 RepID=A0A1H2U6N4_9BACL|nr:aspartate 1-decarboxylase [Alicyclobacillus hesperidum]EJY57082.1 aspartate 1-decarboxylase [Alicyclobacillus hesperidum URH17-3-68]GLV14099.1 aspartate 1-decarboxylase [Alicyclobacillus hesperidum]SDW51700.1 L-aspartate 1-decarboxylase [Alicyclobacillus hesperidum]
MLRKVCKGKLHRVRVTQADLNYMGSITLDPALMRAARIRPYEMVQITSLENGVIWHTYAIEGQENSGVVCLNGPPARHFQPGDHAIVLSLAWIDESEWEDFTASVVFVGDHNEITSVVTSRPFDGWQDGP